MLTKQSQPNKKGIKYEIKEIAVMFAARHFIRIYGLYDAAG